MVVNPTIQYALYELGTRLWRQRQARLSAPAAKLHSLTSLEIFAVASLAKLGATLLTYPLLVVKNRTQVRSAVPRTASLLTRTLLPCWR